MRTVRIAALAATLALAAASPAAAIQPGDYIETDVGSCTVSFAFTGPGGKAFMSTAAHCVDQVGQDVRDWDGNVFADVAAIGDADVTADDWALLEVRSGVTVNPALRGHPTVPRGGYTTSGETRTGDRIVFSGYGIGYDLTALTREQRPVLLTFDDAEIWGAAGTLINGDSGGPLVHGPTGKALGIESRVCLGVCTDEGPTVEGIVVKAAAAGYPITLRTVS